VTFRGHRPTRVKLLGGEGGDPQLRAILNAALSVPVEAGKPLHSVETRLMPEADRQGPMSEWAMALGLALRMTRQTYAPRDGKARVSYGKPAEVVDLNALIPPPGGSARGDRAGKIPGFGRWRKVSRRRREPHGGGGNESRVRRRELESGMW